MSTTFVGREEELKSISVILQEVASSRVPSCVSISGPGGIGKTKLLLEVQKLSKNQGHSPSTIIDLGSVASRSIVKILKMLAESDAFNQFYFSPFHRILAEFELARDIEKFTLYQKVLSAFIECCEAHSLERPIVLMLDTYEAVQAGLRKTKIHEVLSALRGAVTIVLAGRKPIISPMSLSADYVLRVFDLEETTKLASTIFLDRQLDYDLDPETVNLLHKKSFGLPILISLAIDWIIEYAQPEDDLRHDLQEMTGRQFEQKMVSDLRRLKDEEAQTILYMASANLRFNGEIAFALTGNPNSASICEQLTRLSFIKYREDEGGRVYVLHDEMLRLIQEHVDYRREFKDKIRRGLVERYYDQEILAIPDAFLRQTLLGEKIYYQAHYDPDGAIELFNNEIRRLIREYDFDSASQLLEQTKQAPLTHEANNWILLGEAEMMLKQYRPSDAKIILDELLNSMPSSRDAEYRCRVLAGIGEYITNPCTSVEADLFEAIPYWYQSLEVAREARLVELEPEILYRLATTHVLVGQHDHALLVFENALQLVREIKNKRLEAKILDELGKLFRMMQELDKARLPIEMSMAIRREIGDDKYLGLSIYYLGNLYRDLNHFEEAKHYYELASQMLADVGDVAALCELYSDMSWYYVLKDNLGDAAFYNQLSQDLAQQYGFGRELSEALHILYHLEMERGNYDLAQDFVTKAYQVAKKYPNVYMILDCLMHIAQDAYHKKQYERIPSILDEMRELEEQGCGIKVFRGRTRMVFGDYYFDIGDYENAIFQWKEGLGQIALYGNSRTNIELFDDYISVRKEKLHLALSELGPQYATSLKQFWDETVLQRGYEFSQVPKICDAVINPSATERIEGQ